MRYIVSGLIVLGLFFSQTANAQIGDLFRIGSRDNGPERSESRIEDRQERLENRKVEIQERMEDRGVHLDERKQDRIKNFIEIIFNRFTAATERLDGLSERIQNRIDKFEERGVDVTEPQNLLDEATVLIDSLISDIRSVKDDLGASLEENPSREEIREVITGLKDKLKEAHATLVESIRSLKSLGNNGREEGVDNNEEEEGEE